MSTTLSAGGRFGGAFLLLRPLGSGGMANVWLAREEELGREVALKILHRASDADRERFLAEAKSLAAVRHPGVVSVLRFGVDRATDLPFFAMPVYPGTLADRLEREGRLSEARTVELGMSLVPAITALHSAGLAHRDLKPSNVLLDEQGAPVLSDIGPRNGGTPAWAAPEQLSGKSMSASIVPDRAVDWHALGLLLYRALVGSLPPPRGILPASVEPPRGTLPRDLRPRPSRDWERLFVALLAPDPATRLADPDAVLRALRRIRRRACRRASRLVLLALVVGLAAALFWTVVRPAVRPEHDIVDGERQPDGQETSPSAAPPHPVLDPVADDVVRVPEGAVLVAEEFTEGPATAILLDGGTLFLGPQSGTRYIPWSILVGEKGGILERCDEDNEATYCVTNAIRRAPGVASATLECRGFTGLILNRKKIDPGLTVTGLGSVADFSPDGRPRNRRWFDPKEPL